MDELLAWVGEKRKEQKVSEADELSESDDEY